MLGNNRFETDLALTQDVFKSRILSGLYNMLLMNCDLKAEEKTLFFSWHCGLEVKYDVHSCHNIITLHYTHWVVGLFWTASTHILT